MTLIPFPGRFVATGEVLAEFGSAQLVRRGVGRLELRGGSTQERAEAREWASLFLNSEYVDWHPAVAA